jgi:hypothetical protein
VTAWIFSRQEPIRAVIHRLGLTAFRLLKRTAYKKVFRAWLLVFRSRLYEQLKTNHEHLT